MNDRREVSRREWLRLTGSGMVAASPFATMAATFAGCASQRVAASPEVLFVASNFTEPGSFTRGVEGPALDRQGNLYAVNFARQSTIGKVTPDGVGTVFVELSGGSIANGIRFNSRGEMLLADYVNHNILKVDMATRAISVLANQPQMSQPNDLAIGANDILYASDPNWGQSTGQVWRITADGRTTLLEGGMGTTNGIEVGTDERTLYVNESGSRTVWAYDLSPQGDISNKRVLIRFPDGGMDGMRCDVDGNLYVSRYGKGTIDVVSSAGNQVREIALASGRNVTNLEFGGADGRTVFLTVADVGNIQSFRTDRPGRSWVLQQRRVS